MKSYKSLFRSGFVFNDKVYDSNFHITNYFNLVKDLLDGEHGELPKSKELSLMFKSSIRLEFEDLPPSVQKNGQYRQLGDIYVITHKGSDKMKREIKQFAEFMKLNVNIW